MENEPINLPKNSRIVVDEKGEVIGVSTSDGSWDTSRDGQDFLAEKRPLREEIEKK